MLGAISGSLSLLLAAAVSEETSIGFEGLVALWLTANPTSAFSSHHGPGNRFRQSSRFRRALGSYPGADGQKLEDWLHEETRGHEGESRSLSSASTRLCMEALGMAMIRTRDKAWDNGLAHLAEYKEDHGNCRVPSAFESADGFKLGKWVCRQRSKYKGTRGTLTETQKSRLEALGMVWDEQYNIRTKTWDDWYAILEKHKLEYGTCNLPTNYITEEGYQLGKWISRNREKYKGKRGGLTKSQLERLEALGFTFDFAAEQVWKVGYSALEAYKAEHGDCNVPESFTTADGFNLWGWLSFYRRRYEGLRKDDLEEPERSKAKALEELGFTF